MSCFRVSGHLGELTQQRSIRLDRPQVRFSIPKHQALVFDKKPVLSLKHLFQYSLGTLGSELKSHVHAQLRPLAENPTHTLSLTLLTNPYT